LVGLSETPSLPALERMAASVLPSFKPITRVGVLCFAKFFSSVTSDFDQSFPVLRVDFGIVLFTPPNLNIAGTPQSAEEFPT
jgi:hypothetical protein